MRKNLITSIKLALLWRVKNHWHHRNPLWFLIRFQVVVLVVVEARPEFLMAGLHRLGIYQNLIYLLRMQRLSILGKVLSVRLIKHLLHRLHMMLHVRYLGITLRRKQRLPWQLDGLLWNSLRFINVTLPCTWFNLGCKRIRCLLPKHRFL